VAAPPSRNYDTGIRVRRTGIDLSSERCILVDASLATRWRNPGERSLLRVHQFARIDGAASAEALKAKLNILNKDTAFSRHAWVTLWGVPSTHQYLPLTAERQIEGDAIARARGAAVLGLDPAAISVATVAADEGVTMFAAGTESIRVKLRALETAGFVIDGVCTPCGALWAQARLRRSAEPGLVHAYVAIGAFASAMVMVSDGFLLYAKEMAWGFTSEVDVSGRLAADLKWSFLYLKQYWDEDVSQVLLCGDMPEIRSLTAPLIERLDIDVETLDSLDGFDARSLRPPVDQFADRVASLRLAAAIAADPPPANLLTAGTPSWRATSLARPALAAGLFAALGLAGFLYGARDTHQVDAPPVVATDVRLNPEPAHLQAPRAPAEPRLPAVTHQPMLPEPVRPMILKEAPHADAPDKRERVPAAGTDGPVRPAVVRPAPVVQAIVFSSQQRSAIVDSRIVRPGDRVGADTVTAIEPNGLVLVSTGGRVTRLVLNQPKTTATKTMGRYRPTYEEDVSAQENR
jgi:hypothetical protein